MIIWDEEKREQVIPDHRVDFIVVSEVFDDPYAVHLEDHDHSTD